MFAQAFDVAHLEPRVLDAAHDAADLVQLAVGEHEPVDEPVSAEARARLARRTRDPVVQEPSARTEQRVQMREVLRQTLGPHVLEHSDARDRVVGPVVDVAFVLDADLDSVGYSGLRHSLRGQLGLPL